MASENEIRKRWTDDAGALLKGRTITGVRYLSDEETEAMGWHHASVVIELSGVGTKPPISIWPSSDDEGNNAGSIFTTDEGMNTIPVI